MAGGIARTGRCWCGRNYCTQTSVLLIWHEGGHITMPQMRSQITALATTHVNTHISKHTHSLSHTQTHIHIYTHTSATHSWRLSVRRGRLRGLFLLTPNKERRLECSMIELNAFDFLWKGMPLQNVIKKRSKKDPSYLAGYNSDTHINSFFF